VRQSEAPEPRRVRQNFGRAIQHWNGDYPSGGLLLIEDDIRLRADWRELLWVIVQGDYPTICCSLELRTIPAPFSALARADLNEPPTVRPRVAPMVNTGEYYGSQCVYLPKWFIPNITSQELMMSDSPRGMAFDGVLNYMAGQTPVNLGLMVSIPDLAHHTSPPAVLNPLRPVRMEHMFDWRIDWRAYGANVQPD